MALKQTKKINSVLIYRKYIKRFLDIVLSFLGIVICIIPMIFVAFVIYCDDCGNVIFSQKRIGKDKKIFLLYKFRTMNLNTPNIPTYLLESPECYLLRSGNFIRRFSLDELPQLFNILKGDMSFIGPRPAQWNDSAMIELRDKNNSNSIRPGLSGWAQINGRDTLEIEKKAEYDGEYLSRESFLFDAYIFFVTIIKVLQQKDVVEGGTGALKKDENSKI